MPHQIPEISFGCEVCSMVFTISTNFFRAQRKEGLLVPGILDVLGTALQT